MSENKKDYQVAFILSILGGMLGIDRFYVGDIGLGVLKFFTAGGFFIWYIVDIFHFYKLMRDNPNSSTSSNNNRREILEAKYDAETVQRILHRKPIIGDSMDIIKDMYGNPHKLDKEATEKSLKYTFKYFETKKGVYSLSIIIKDDKVVKIVDKR